MGIYDIFNINGDRLCHARGCRKHTKLTASHGGIFCRKHLEEIRIIRKEIVKCKGSDDVYTETYYRQREISFRKIFDGPHIHYLFTLEKGTGIDSGYG